MKGNVRDIWIDRIGMTAIVVVSLGYILFGSTFAQLRLQFSFLDFPIFIGEILLFFCSLLFIVKNIGQKWELDRWGWVLGAYLLFILIKAFSGYFSWGPLAFRDAALFYYPLFTVLGYSFWSYGLGGHRTRILAVVLIVAIFILQQFVSFWPCSLIIIGVIAALKARNLAERGILLGAILIFAPYGVVFNTFSRTVFLSSMITAIFIGFMLFLLFCTNRWVRIVGLVLGCLILGIVSFKASQTKIGSTFGVQDAQPMADGSSEEISRGKYLFHPVGSSSEKPDTMKEFWQRIHKECFFTNKKCTVEKAAAIEQKPVTEKETTAKKQAVLEEKKIAIGNKKNDTLFRYYIWRDMVFEFVRYKPLWGFAFGRPLRSTSILKYFGDSSTLSTDGWVGAHNSFFNMIYRAGIVGLAMVLFLMMRWFDLVRDFYILRDWTGILLCAVLLNWIISANFFLIFELPYTAIPVWTVLGITLKHRKLLEKTGS